MPIKSERQRRFMYASLAGKTDVPASVAKKFVGPKAHNDGGAVKESPVKKPLPPFMKKEAKKPADKAHGKAEVAFMKAKGAPKAMIAKEKAEYGLRKGGKPKKMAYGGKAC
jgi:hypothetical protein